MLGLKRLHGFLEVTTAQVHNGNYAKWFGINKWYQSLALRNFDLEDMELESTNSGPTAKLPILKLGEYEMWDIRDLSSTFQIKTMTLRSGKKRVIRIRREDMKKGNDVKATGPNKLDLSYSGLDEFKEPEFKGYGHENKQEFPRSKRSFCGRLWVLTLVRVVSDSRNLRKVRENRMLHLLRKGLFVDDEEQDESKTKPERKLLFLLLLK
ncbi:hypothetical protein Tco_1335678 [Tanacetum coccineum]